MSDSNTTLDEVRRLVCEAMSEQPADLQPDTPLLDSGLLDSFGVLAVIEGLEQRFGIAFRNEDLVQGNFQSLRAIAALTDQYGKGQ